MNKMAYVDFCTELHDSTRPAHAHGNHFITVKLIIVLSDMRLYSDVLVNFYHVFKTLEEQIGIYHDHPCIGGVVPEELLRTEACEQDLEFYLGHMWRDEAQISEAGAAYCREIVAAGTTDPTLLLA